MLGVGKIDGCIRAVDISCRKRNSNRADSASCLMNEFCVVESADPVFGLCGNVFSFAKSHDVVIKFHIIKSSVITEGNNLAFALSANKFFARNAGNVTCCGCFNNNGDIRIDGECSISCAVSANFFAGRKADSYIIFRFFSQVRTISSAAMPTPSEQPLPRPRRLHRGRNAVSLIVCHSHG